MVDELTRRRMDSNKSKPDYHLLLDINGYLVGNTDKVRWSIIPIEWSDNIDPDDTEYMSDILEKVVEVLRQ